VVFAIALFACYTWILHCGLPFFTSRSPAVRWVVAGWLAVVPFFTLIFLVLQTSVFYPFGTTMLTRLPAPGGSGNEVWAFNYDYMFDTALAFYARPAGRGKISLARFEPGDEEYRDKYEASFDGGQWTRDGQIFVYWEKLLPYRDHPHPPPT